MRRPGKDFPDMLQKPSTLSVSSWLYIDFEAKIMALSESLLLLTGKTRTCFRENMYVFSGQGNGVFNVLIISVLFECSNDRSYKQLTMGIIKVLQCLL